MEDMCAGMQHLTIPHLLQDSISMKLTRFPIHPSRQSLSGGSLMEQRPRKLGIQDSA